MGAYIFSAGVQVDHSSSNIALYIFVDLTINWHKI